MEHEEELRELIRLLVRQPALKDDGTGGAPARIPAVEGTTYQKIPDELVRIR